MATVVDLMTQAAAAVAAISGVDGRLPADYRGNVGGLVAGETRFALRGNEIAKDERNSNVVYPIGSIELDMVHRLADPLDERAYTEAEMLTHQSVLVAKSWWRALAAAHSVFDSNLEVSEEATRTGNVIKYTVAVQIQVTTA